MLEDNYDKNLNDLNKPLLSYINNYNKDYDIHCNIKNKRANLSLYKLTYKIAVESFPVSIGLIFTILVETINIIYIGKLNNPKKLVAIGIGTCLVNILGCLPLNGIQGGIDTLCSDANGRKSFNKIIIYVNISRLVTIVYYLLVYIPYTYLIPYITYYLTYDTEIVDLVKLFSNSMKIAVFFVSQREILNRYMQSMLIYKPSMIITIICSIFHPLWAYILVFKLNLDIKGTGYSLAITELLNCLMLMIYINYNTEINKKCCNPNLLKNFNSYNITKVFDVKNIKKFLKYAVPSGILIIIESLVFQFLIFISSILGVYETDATICLFNIGNLIFIFTLGISITTSNYVGNSIGQNNAKLANMFAFSGILYTTLFSILIMILFFIFKINLIKLYTTNTKIIEIFNSISIYFNIYLLIDNIGVTINGVVRGLGRQAKALKYTLLSNYILGFPFSLVFVFVLNYGITGLWSSQLIIVILYFVSISYVCFSKSTQKIIKERSKNS